MKNYLFIVFLLPNILMAQIKATTDDGRKVLLKNDNTWEYVQSNENQNIDCENSIWEKKYYVDEFKQPTEEGYIRNKSYLEGTFSNSATTNSKLNVRLLIDDDSFSMMLYEYGSMQMKDVISTRYEISIRDAITGDKYSFRSFESSGDRVTIRQLGNKKDFLELIRILKIGSKYDISLKSNDIVSKSYLFSFDASCFKEMYEQL